MGRIDVERMTASIYGTVLTIALIAAYSAEESLEPLLIAVAVVVTTSVFWLAHAQAQLLAERYAAGHALPLSEVRARVRDAWPMVEASLLPALGLLAGTVGLVDDDSAVDVALGIGIAQLAGWGLAIGRRERLSAPRTVAVTAINVALGLAVVLLKLLIH